MVPRTAHAGSRRYSPSSLVWCGRAPPPPPCPRPPLASSRPAGRPVPSNWSRPRSRTVVGHRRRRSRGARTPLSLTRPPGGRAGAGRGRRRRARRLGGAAPWCSRSRPYLRPQAWRPCWADGRRRAHRVNDRAPPAPRPPRQRCAYYRSSTSATCDPLRAAPRGGSGLTRFAYSRSDSLASSVGSPSMIRETLCFYSARGKIQEHSRDSAERVDHDRNPLYSSLRSHACHVMQKESNPCLQTAQSPKEPHA